MKIENTQVTKLNIIEAPALDPITVILEDYEPGRGKIIIECFGKSWSSYWGAMSGRTISQFFCDCDNDYIAKNLAGGIRGAVTDEEGIPDAAKAHIVKLRKERDFSKDDARDLYDKVDCPFFCYKTNPNTMQQIYGDEWWYSLPEKSNHDYEYLCRIINAVRAALKSTKDKEEPTDDGALKNKILEWFIKGRVGASSTAMAGCIAGIETREKSHPYDAADLNRCLLFLDAVPEARLHMDKLRTLSPTWDRLVDRWKELESTFMEEVGLNWSHGDKASKTYKLMNEIQNR